MKALIFSILALATFLACDDSQGVTESPGGGTSSGQSSSGDAGLDEAGKPKDCFDPPLTTHLQIINACTDADKVVRTPKSSKIPTDGGALPKP